MSTQDQLRCIICGELSHTIVESICDKPCCNRHREEGKAEIAMQIAQTEKLAREYAGRGYE